MLKKVLLLLLITLTLPGFADNKDVFTPKEYVLTIPKILQDEDVYEEKELALEWNQWHAKVRNSMMKPIWNPCGKLNCFVVYSYYVDSQGKISDIFVGICTAKSLNIDNVSMNGGGVMYGYSYDDNKFYKFTASKEFSLQDNKWKELKYLSANMNTMQVEAEEVPIKTELVKTASNIKNSEHSSFYKYPDKSQRTKVIVSAGWIDTRITHGTGGYYKSSQFNDVENIKYTQIKR